MIRVLCPVILGFVNDLRVSFPRSLAVIGSFYLFFVYIHPQSFVTGTQKTYKIDDSQNKDRPHLKILRVVVVVKGGGVVVV